MNMKNRSFKIFEFVLPRVLSCKNAFEVWDIIHKYFNAHMKACVRQLHVELKSIKKGTSLVIESLLHVKAITNSLLAVGDNDHEHDQIDFIFNGLLEEFNPFVMQMYNAYEPQYLYDVDAFLYVQKAQLDNFRQELAIFSISANIVNANLQTVGVRENSALCRGRGRIFHGQGHSRGLFPSGS